MDHIVLVCLFGENRLEGQPALIVLGPVSIHQLGESGEGKLAVILGLKASQSLPAHKGHSFGGSGIGDFHRLVGNRGDHVAAAQKVAFAIHKAHVDHAVLRRLLSVIRLSVSVLIRSPDSEQSDIVCNGQCAGYKLHICCSFFGLDQSGLSSAPAEESSAVLCETAATQDRDRCIFTIGVAVRYSTFTGIRIVSDLITGNVNNSAVYRYPIGCAIGFRIGQGCALIG